jgi:2-methylisocitrate lyase-like PEP mutase family enzyme
MRRLSDYLSEKELLWVPLVFDPLGARIAETSGFKVLYLGGAALKTAEATGFSAIEIEDQVLPKRAHHHVGIEHNIPASLMVEKIPAAVSARDSQDFLIIARTNAARNDSLDEAVRRGEAYRRGYVAHPPEIA